MVRWDLDAPEFHKELRDEHQSLYKKAIEKWGGDSQLAMAIEECGELIVALCHANRELKNINRAELVEEIADVSLMLEQLCYMIRVAPAEWFIARENKLKRLRELLG